MKRMIQRTRTYISIHYHEIVHTMKSVFCWRCFISFSLFLLLSLHSIQSDTTISKAIHVSIPPAVLLCILLYSIWRFCCYSVHIFCRIILPISVIDLCLAASASNRPTHTYTHMQPNNKSPLERSARGRRPRTTTATIFQPLALSLSRQPNSLFSILGAVRNTGLACYRSIE